MSLKIRKIIFLVLGSLLFVTILNLLLGLFRFPFLSVNPFQAIPNQTSIILESTVDSDLLEHVQQFDGLNDLPFIKRLERDQQLIQDFIGDSILTDQKIRTLFSLQKVGAGKLDFLYVFDIRNLDISKKEFKNLMNGVEVMEWNFQGKNYQKITLKEGEVFTFYRYKNLILTSRYPVLVEEGIRQLNNYRSNLGFDQELSRIRKERNKNALVNLYVNFGYLPKEVRTFFKFKHYNAIQSLSNFATWASISIDSFSNIKGKYITPQPFRYRKNLKGVHQMDVLNAIPDNTGVLYAQQGVHLKGMKDSLFQEYIQPWLSDEWAFTVVNPKTSVDQLLVLKTEDAELAHHYLSRFGKHQGELLYTSYQTYPLVQWLENDCIHPFLDHLQLEMQNPFYTVIGQCVLFSNSKQSLETAIDKFIVGQTIFKNKDFQKYLNGLSDKSSSILYWDGAAITDILEKALLDEFSNSMEGKYLSKIEKLKGGCEFFNGKKMVPFDLIQNSTENASDQTEVAWRTAFPADVIGKPKPIWNPSKKEFEILVQDRLHNLYLINNGGEILWKRALRDTLLSDIYEIDYHEDGSLKFLFNTANNIFLLDREGRDIGNYPLHLQSPASNGMCVVDFKKDKKYQMFLACKNGKAYGFTKEGNPLYGWKPKKNIGKVYQPFQHFEYRNRDYLVVLNDDGKLATFDSEGKRIIKRLSVGNSYRNSPEILSIGKRKVIALTNDKGQVKIVNNRGDAYNIALTENKKDPVQCTIANITGDSRKDFITLVSNRLVCFSQEKNKLKQHFEIVLENQQDELFEVEMPKDDYSCIGTLCKSKKQINLFDGQNALHQGFPIAGTTAFSIVDLFNNGNNVLLVGYNNALYAYQIVDNNKLVSR